MNYGLLSNVLFVHKFGGRLEVAARYISSVAPL